VNSQAVEKRVGDSADRVNAPAERVEGGRDILCLADFGCGDVKTERPGRCMKLAHLCLEARIFGIGQDRQSTIVGDQLAKNLEPFASEIDRFGGRASDVAAGSRKTGDQADANGISGEPKHDGDHRGHLFGCNCGCGPPSENDIDPILDKLGGGLGGALAASLSPAILDGDCAAFGPAELAQPRCRVSRRS
jgi:hypothetical protein